MTGKKYRFTGKSKNIVCSWQLGGFSSSYPITVSSVSTFLPSCQHPNLKRPCKVSLIGWYSSSMKASEGPKNSHCKAKRKKIVFVWDYCGNHLAKYISEVFMLYTLNLYSAVCQLCINKTERWWIQKKANPYVNLLSCRKYSHAGDNTAQLHSVEFDWI